jgi:prevent-host-death family protein
MKAVSVSEAREQFSSFINWTTQNQDDVIIQNRGQAKAVLIPYADYRLLQIAREQQRKKEAIEELKQIAQAVRSRNQIMTSNEAERVADEVTREAIDSLMAQGKVIFEE